MAKSIGNSYEQNRLLAEHEYNIRTVVLKSKPEIFAIESTNFCNIKCVMCPRGEPDIMRRPLGHMSNEVLQRVIDQAEYFAAPAWLHWFGEPLMNPMLFEQIEIAKQKIHNLGISTNATLLNEANQQRILESNLDSIIIAIDGDSKSVYERVRKSARFTFDEVCANTEGFLARRNAAGLHRPRVTLSIIVMDETAGDLQNFKRHWEQHGADEILFKPFVNWGGQKSETFDNLEIVSQRAKLSSPRAHPCKFMWESLLVTWDGRVVPCCYDFDAKLVLGDLKTQTMDEIWNGPAYVELRKAELEGRNRSELCRNCSQAPGYASVQELIEQPEMNFTSKAKIRQFATKIFGRGVLPPPSADRDSRF